MDLQMIAASQTIGVNVQLKFDRGSPERPTATSEGPHVRFRLGPLFARARGFLTSVATRLVFPARAS